MAGMIFQTRSKQLFVRQTFRQVIISRIAYQFLNFTAVPYAMTSAAPCMTAADA